MYADNVLEDECYTCGEAVALKGGVVAVVAVEQAKVVAYIEAELVHYLCTDSAACENIETAVVAAVCIVIGSAGSAAEAGDTAGCNGLGCDADTGGRTTVYEQFECFCQGKRETQVEGNIHIMLCGFAAIRDGAEATCVAVCQKLIVETGVEAKVVCKWCSVAEACVKTVCRCRMGTIGLSRLNITCTKVLCESGGANKQQSCCDC